MEHRSPFSEKKNVHPYPESPAPYSDIARPYPGRNYAYTHSARNSTEFQVTNDEDPAYVDLRQFPGGCVHSMSVGDSWSCIGACVGRGRRHRRGGGIGR